MAGPIIPAMPLATALVLGIPSYWPWHSSCCWNVTAADRCAVAAVHVHAAAAAISVPAAAAIAAAATRDAAGAILATDEPKARWAWPSSKKSGPRMPFLAAYLSRLWRYTLALMSAEPRYLGCQLEGWSKLRPKYTFG